MNLWSVQTNNIRKKKAGGKDVLLKSLKTAQGGRDGGRNTFENTEK